jgi:hypothetical protein
MKTKSSHSEDLRFDFSEEPSGLGYDLTTPPPSFDNPLEEYHGGLKGSWSTPSIGESPEAQKLRMLLTICKRSDNPSAAVSLQEIAEILLDLGMRLSLNEFSGNENSDVFEDPFGRGDALGNIKMIHKRMSTPDQGLCRSLGQALLKLVHSLITNRRGIKSTQMGLDESPLDDWDEVASSEFLAARRKIGSLRKDNNKLLSANLHLRGHLYSLEDRYDNLLSKYKFLLLLLKLNRIRPGFRGHGFDSCHQDHPRKVSKTEQIQQSQTDGLNWD